MEPTNESEMNGMRKLLERKIYLVLMYACIYFLLFRALEGRITGQEYLIHSVIDDRIPFVKYFIIPYLFWFPYVAVTFIFIALQEAEEYIRMIIMLFSGTTLFLVISLIFPNCLDLRPALDPADTSLLISLTRHVYTSDTATNVFPSMHVFVTICMFVATIRSKAAEKYLWIKIASGLILVAICASTVFTKQHSVLDVAGGVIYAFLLYLAAYRIKLPERAAKRVL